MSVTLDPRDLVLRRSPVEWPHIPEELINRLTAGPPQPIRDPVTGKWYHFPQIPMLTTEQKKQIDTIAAARWFLIRIAHDVTLRACRRCGRRHTYYTQMCVEFPFNGITDLSQALLRQEAGGDQTFTAVSLGDLEPIAADKARVYRERIIMRGGIPSPIGPSRFEALSYSRAV